MEFVSFTYEYETKNKFIRFVWFKHANVLLEKTKLNEKQTKKNHKYSIFYGNYQGFVYKIYIYENIKVNLLQKSTFIIHSKFIQSPNRKKSVYLLSCYIAR